MLKAKHVTQLNRGLWRPSAQILYCAQFVQNRHTLIFYCVTESPLNGGEFLGKKARDVITRISQIMDESLLSMRCNVSITCQLVCSLHSARLRDALKTACKNVIFKHHTVKGCFAKPVFSCTRVRSHLCVPSLFFFSCLHSIHDLEVFNQVLCCFLYYSDLKKPPTHFKTFAYKLHLLL